METIIEYLLPEWTDADIAMFTLGCHLGLFHPGKFQEVKYIFWTNNSLGNTLYEILLTLVRERVLEMNVDDNYETRFRTNKEYIIGQQPETNRGSDNSMETNGSSMY